MSVDLQAAKARTRRWGIAVWRPPGLWAAGCCCLAKQGTPVLSPVFTEKAIPGCPFLRWASSASLQVPEAIGSAAPFPCQLPSWLLPLCAPAPSISGLFGLNCLCLRDPPRLAFFLFFFLILISNFWGRKAYWLLLDLVMSPVPVSMYGKGQSQAEPMWIQGRHPCALLDVGRNSPEKANWAGNVEGIHWNPFTYDPINERGC